MFKELFDRPDAVSRQLDAPMVEERLLFLSHQAERDMARNTLRSYANNMIEISRELEIVDKSDRVFTTQEIDQYAKKWARNRARPNQSENGSPTAIKRFSSCATQWLRYMGRLHEEPVARTAYADEVEDFAAYMVNDRGLSPGTVASQSWVASNFLCQLDSAGFVLSQVSIVDVESILIARMKAGTYQRVSIRTFTSSVRSFFRYAETRGWCTAGIAAAIKAARAFPQERLPSGPKWTDVQRLLATTEDEHPTNVRDRAILNLPGNNGYSVKLRLPSHSLPGLYFRSLCDDGFYCNRFQCIRIRLLSSPVAYETIRHEQLLLSACGRNSLNMHCQSSRPSCSCWSGYRFV